MKVIGIYNIKGGVGKTATAVNFSYLSGKNGDKTLLWDLDPQGSSTFYLNMESPNDFQLKKVLNGKENILHFTQITEYDNLWCIPSDLSYRNMELILDNAKKSKKRIREALKEVENSFDYVFLDCPPGISVLAENIFYACDFVIVPTIPTPLSIRTYEQIMQFFKEQELDTSIIIPFYSMVELRKSVHHSILYDSPFKIKGMCVNFIPFLAEIEKMGIYKSPVETYSPASRAAESFAELWNEIKRKIQRKK